MPKPWLIILALSLTAAAFAIGHHRGVSAEETRQALRVAEAQRQMIRAAETASRAEAERLAIQAELDALALELEDLVRADPDASSPAFSVDSVRRLNHR